MGAYKEQIITEGLETQALSIEYVYDDTETLRVPIIPAEAEVVPPLEIPQDKLSSEALEGLIEEFILREGTDYGAEEVNLDRKKEQVRKQLDKEEIKIVFDFTTASVTLMTNQEFSKHNH